MKHYDAIVIGAGPGGYESALEVARSGMKTLLIDRTKERIGGTCLNEGCIPTKNYLASAAYLSKASYFSDCGIVLEINGLNLARLEEKTIRLKNEIRTGIVWLLDQAGVETVYGNASFADEYTLDVSGEQIRFDKCIIATGSQSKTIEQLPQDGKRILSSCDIFELKTLPSSIAIVGGGPIGCEFATFFSAFGISVTLIVRGTQLLSDEDEEVAKALLRVFKKRNINVMTSAAVRHAVIGDGGVELVIKGEEEVQMTCDIVLCATGRIPYTEGLSLENAGVGLDDKGFIEVNETFQTSKNHIYAVGDCINTPAYAHTAYTEAHIAAHNLINGSADANEHLTPSTIFTDPQIASCGLQERDAKAQGRAVIVKKAFFKTNAKAKIAGDDSGFVKLIVCASSGVILGATIIGVEATEIIHEFIVAIEKEIRADDLSALIHAHPTLSEIIRLL